MYRTDAADNVGNLFDDGDPGSGREGTVVDADWLNAVQEELCGVVEGMGLTLSAADRGQLLAAILRLQQRVNTWEALQKIAAALEITGGGISLTQAALQAVRKTGGKLQVGTGSAHDLELTRGDVVFLALTASGVELGGRNLLGAAQVRLAANTGDVSTVDGSVWYRSDLNKLRARLAGASTALVTENKFAAGWVNGSTGALTRTLGGLSVAVVRASAGLYTISAANAHNGLCVASIVRGAGGGDRTIRVYPPSTPGQVQVETHDADTDDGGAVDCDFMFRLDVP